MLECESDLAFYTTQELIDELLRRKTFAGVVIRSEQEYRCNNRGEKRIFKAYHKNLSAAEVGQLLDAVVQQLDRQGCVDQDQTDQDQAD